MAHRMMLIYRDPYLIPNDRVSTETYDKLRNGEIYAVSFKRARNPHFHAKMFAVLNAMYENQESIDGFENFRHELLLALKYVHSYTVKKSGAVKVRVKSMSFDEMDDDEFQQLYNDVLSFAARRYGDAFVRQFEPI